MTEDDLARFWAKVDRSGECWNWTACTRDGYGLFCKIRGASSVNAHRFSWALCHGEVPRGLLVLHKCDNRKCVRPDHLFLGTIADNMRDRNNKGRQARGSSSGRATISEATAIAIRAMNPDGRRAKWGEIKAIAEMFGADRQTVSNVWTRKTWRHI